MSESTTEVQSPETSFLSEVLETPELKLPPEVADAHRVKITGVNAKTTDSGATAIVVDMESLETGSSLTRQIWLPEEFVDDIHVNPDSISDDVPEGKKQSPRQRYGATVQNSRGTAELQKLIAVAQREGRASKRSVSDFDDFVEFLSDMLTGIEAVATRRPQKSENAQYDGRLEVNRILSGSIIFDPKASKTLRGYKKRWEQQ